MSHSALLCFALLLSPSFIKKSLFTKKLHCDRIIKPYKLPSEGYAELWVLHTVSKRSGGHYYSHFHQQICHG